jgi:diacylglycerol kinase family enzyme
MTQRYRVRVFLNRRSGAGGVSPRKLCKLFAAHDCTCEVTLLDRHVNLKTLASRDLHSTAWIAAGGDGTVNTVAQAIAGSPRPLGILPVGTLNHLAGDLNLPLDLAQAIKIAVHGETRLIDAATVNGVFFLNNSSLGVYPAMVLDRERMKKSGWNKWMSLVVASARAFLRFRCLEVDLEIDGQLRECATPLLFVGNNPYTLEGGNLTRRERLNIGLLSVFIIPHATRATMLRLFASSLIGKVRGAPELEEFLVPGFKVNSRIPRLRVAFDGEVRRMEPPLHYLSKPGALHVICPAGPTS